jgi:glycosyltransferase involved in cell wall biosynthesis
MTIVFLSRKFYPHIGGVEKHVQEISKILVKKGHRVIVISEQDSKSHSIGYQSKLENARHTGNPIGIKSYKIRVGNDNWFKKFRIWRALWKNRKLILSSDIVHCHDVFFWYLPFKLLFPFKRVYTTFHGYEGNNIPGKKAIFMHKLSEKLSKGNICVGDVLKKWYGTKPNIITYGAVDFQMVNKFLVKNQNTNKFKNKIVFFGRLEDETGVMKYVKALTILKNMKINLELDVFGEGSLKEEINKYNKDNNLRVNVFKPIMNIESVLNNYEYIFCSRYLSILEAMAFKKPIFAEYNNKIKKDYLTMAPFSKYIAIAKDEDEIAKEVVNLRSGKSNISIGKAYEWVKTETWEKMTDNYLKLWNFR